MRPADWEFGVSVQQEAAARIGGGRGTSAAGSSNFFVDDNLATRAGRLHAFQHLRACPMRVCRMAANNVIAGLYDVSAAKFGQVNNYFTFDGDVRRLPISTTTEFS